MIVNVYARHFWSCKTVIVKNEIKFVLAWSPDSISSGGGGLAEKWNSSSTFALANVGNVGNVGHVGYGWLWRYLAISFYVYFSDTAMMPNARGWTILRRQDKRGLGSCLTLSTLSENVRTSMNQLHPMPPLPSLLSWPSKVGLQTDSCRRRAWNLREASRKLQIPKADGLQVKHKHLAMWQ